MDKLWCVYCINWVIWECADPIEFTGWSLCAYLVWRDKTRLEHVLMSYQFKAIHISTPPYHFSLCITNFEILVGHVCAQKAHKMFGSGYLCKNYHFPVGGVVFVSADFFFFLHMSHIDRILIIKHVFIAVWSISSLGPFCWRVFSDWAITWVPRGMT